jgi:hypothetical protein
MPHILIADGKLKGLVGTNMNQYISPMKTPFMVYWGITYPV